MTKKRDRKQERGFSKKYRLLPLERHFVRLWTKSRHVFYLPDPIFLQISTKKSPKPPNAAWRASQHWMHSIPICFAVPDLLPVNPLSNWY